MTDFTATATLLEKARAGRRAALTSLHSRLGHTDKVVSIFDNAFPQRIAEPQFRSVRIVAGHRPASLDLGLAAA
ncbi:MAG: hypothetical protein KDK28_06520 [Maritimibacter sp.]|nr:hypothetical protein [Maritimibacter sp.]